MLYKTILALKKKWVKCFWEIHYLGIQGRGKGHKVKHLKIIFKKILMANLESLVNFL